MLRETDVPRMMTRVATTLQRAARSPEGAVGVMHLAAEGDDEHKMVTLTQKGIDQIGLQTAVVGGGPDEMVIPYSALLYAADGEHAYVYANPEGRSYERHNVTVLQVDGDRVLISDGPPVGSRVVTQGVAQVHGAELEFGKY